MVYAQAAHHQRMSMTSTVSLALRRRGESMLYLPNPGEESPLPRFHPAPSRNDVAVVQPVVVSLRLSRHASPPLRLRPPLVADLFLCARMTGQEHWKRHADRHCFPLTRAAHCDEAWTYQVLDPTTSSTASTPPRTECLSPRLSDGCERLLALATRSYVARVHLIYLLRRRARLSTERHVRRSGAR